MIQVRKIQIPELPTQKPRKLYIYLPNGYKTSEKRYPVIYMFDGHNVFYDSHATYGKSWGMREYLKCSKKEVILVAVECNPEGIRRLFEYSPWEFRGGRFGVIGGLGKVTMDYFTKELKPQIDAEFRTLPDREHTMIAGSSMGGLMSIYALVEYNDVFSRAAALSPSLWTSPSSMRELIKSHTLLEPTRLYTDMGGAETEGHTEPFEAIFSVAKQLSKKGAHVAARVVPGALHSEAYWEERIPVFMDYLTFDDNE